LIVGAIGASVHGKGSGLRVVGTGQPESQQRAYLNQRSLSGYG
jgi:hypothetical protein